MVEQFQAEYDYCAFISFSSDDADTATWLRNKLDRFNIPTFVREQYNINKKRLKPSYTYLHASEAGNELRNELENKLRKSRYLIVLCSPNSASSEICDWEIETFINLGRKHCIIPLIIDGQPYSDDVATECLSPSLKKAFPRSDDFNSDRQIKCANLNEKGILWYERRDHAFAQIIARILSVNSDKLWDWVRHKKQFRSLATAVFAIFALLIGLSAFSYYTTSYSYFRDYADCYGVPQGIIQIKNIKSSKYPYYYRFESSRGNLDRVVYCNSSGIAQNHSDTEYNSRPAIMEFAYDSGNEITVTKRDKDGVFLLKERISMDRTSVELVEESSQDAATIAGNTSSMFQSQTSAVQGGMFDFMHMTRNAKAKISRYVIERDADGFIIRKMFKKYRGESVPSKDLTGIYGYSYELDSLHRVIKESFLDKDGVTLIDNNIGLAYKTHKYDEKGNMCETRYYDKDGRLTTNELMFCICKTAFSEDGTCIEESYFGADEELCLTRLGFAKVKYFLDDGLIVRQEYYGLDGALTCTFNDADLNLVGGFATVRFSYDDSGYPESVSYYDADGRPCNDAAKVHRTDYVYRDGLPVSETYYNIDGARCVSLYGFSKCVAEYSDRMLASMSYYNVDDRPVNNVNGYAVMRQIVRNGKVVSLRYYDSVGLPAVSPGNGNAHGLNIRYDSVGNPELLSFIGGDEYPMRNLFGFAHCRIIYDENNLGLPSEYHYLDTDGVTPAVHVEGYSVVKYEYDQNGQPVSISSFDEIGEPCMVNATHRFRMEYNEKGQCIRMMSYDVNERLVCNAQSGAAVIEQEFNRGLMISQSAFDADHYPVYEKATGCHQIRYQYDDMNRIVAQTHWNTDMEPMNSLMTGIHKHTKTYDDNNYVIEETTYNADGTLCENMYGVARVEYLYDGQYNNVEKRFYGADNELKVNTLLGCAVTKMEYDRYNQIVSESFYDSDEKPCMCEMNYHRRIRKYNEYSLLVSEVMYDTSGELVDGIGYGDMRTFAKIEYVYKDGTTRMSYAISDSEGQNIDECYCFYNEYGQLAANLYITYNGLAGERIINGVYEVFGGYSCAEETLEKYKELLSEVHGVKPPC